MLLVDTSRLPADGKRAAAYRALAHRGTRESWQTARAETVSGGQGELPHFARHAPPISMVPDQIGGQPIQ